MLKTKVDRKIAKNKLKCFIWTMVIIALLTTQVASNVYAQKIEDLQAPTIYKIYTYPKRITCLDRITVFAEVYDSSGIADIRLTYVNTTGMYNVSMVFSHYNNTHQVFKGYIEKQDENTYPYYFITVKDDSSNHNVGQSPPYYLTIFNPEAPSFRIIKMYPTKPWEGMTPNIEIYCNDPDGISGDVRVAVWHNGTYITTIVGSALGNNKWNFTLPSAARDVKVEYQFIANDGSPQYIEGRSAKYSYVVIPKNELQESSFSVWYAPFSPEIGEGISIYSYIWYPLSEDFVLENVTAEYCIDNGEEKIIQMIQGEEYYLFQSVKTIPPISHQATVCIKIRAIYSYQGIQSEMCSEQITVVVKDNFAPEFKEIQIMNKNNETITDKIPGNEKIIVRTVVYDSSGINYVICYYKDGGEWKGVLLHKESITSSGELWETEIEFQEKTGNTSLYFVAADKSLWVNTNTTEIFGPFSFYDNTPPIIGLTRVQEISYNVPLILRAQIEDSSPINYVKFYLNISNEIIELEGQESAYPNMYIASYTFNMSFVDQEVSYWCEAEDGNGLKNISESYTFTVVDKTVPYFISFTLPPTINCGLTSLEERLVIVNAIDAYDGVFNNTLRVTLTYWGEMIKTKTIELYPNENETTEYYGYLPELSKATTLNFFFTIIDTHGNKFTSQNFKVEYKDTDPPVFNDFRIVKDEYSFEEMGVDYNAKEITILVTAEDKEYTQSAEIIGHSMFYDWGLNQLFDGIKYCSFQPIRTVIENNRTYFWFKIPTDPKIVEQKIAILAKSLGEDISNYNFSIHWDFGDVYQFNVTLYDWQNNVAQTTQLVQVKDKTKPHITSMEVNQDGKNITVDIEIYDISELSFVTVHWTNKTGFQEINASLASSYLGHTQWHVNIPHEWFEETVWVYGTATDIYGNKVDTAEPIEYYQTNYGTELNFNPQIIGDTSGYIEKVEGKATLGEIFDEYSEYVSFTNPSASSLLYSDQYYINATIEDYEKLGYTYAEAQSQYYSFISVHGPLITEEGLTLKFRDDLLSYDTVVVRLPWNFTTSNFLELYLPKYDDALNLTLNIAEKDLVYDKDKGRYQIDISKYPERILSSKNLEDIKEGTNIIPLNLSGIDISRTDLMLELVIKVNQSTIIPNIWEITLGYIRTYECNLGWKYEGKAFHLEPYKYIIVDSNNIKCYNDEQMQRLFWEGKTNLTIPMGEYVGINNLAPYNYLVTKLLFVETNGTIALTFQDGITKFITPSQNIYPIGSMLAEHGLVQNLTLCTFRENETYYVSSFVIYSITPISSITTGAVQHTFYLVGIQNADWGDKLWADGILHYEPSNITDHPETAVMIVTPIKFPIYYGNNVTYYEQFLVELESQNDFGFGTSVISPIFNSMFSYTLQPFQPKNTTLINYVTSAFFVELMENCTGSKYLAIVTNSSFSVASFKINFYSLPVSPLEMFNSKYGEVIFQPDSIYFKVYENVSNIELSLPVNIPCSLFSHIVIEASSYTNNFNITDLIFHYANGTSIVVGNFGYQLITDSGQYLAEATSNRQNETIAMLTVRIENTEHEMNTLLRFGKIHVYHYPVTMNNVKLHDIWAPEIIDHYVQGNVYQQSDMEVRVKVQDILSGLDTSNPAKIEYYYVYYSTVSDPITASMTFDEQTSEWCFIFPDSRNAYKVGYTITNIKDNMGNEAEPLSSIVNVPEVFPPTGTITISKQEANYETESVTITLDAEGTLHNPVETAFVNYTFDHITYYTANMTQGTGTLWHYTIGPYSLDTTVYVKCQFTDWWGNDGETDSIAINWIDLTAPIAINYYQTNYADVGYTVSTEVWAEIEDISGIDTVILYYRIDGGNWINAGTMTEINGKYYGTIPALSSSNVGKYVEYYIYANDTEGNGAPVTTPGDTLCSFWVVDNVAPEINSMSPQSDINEGETATWFISASDEIDSPDLLSAKIYYSINGQGYISASMSYNQLSQNFEYTSVEIFSAGDTVEYYFVVYDSEGNSFTSSTYQRQCVDIYYPSITNIQQNPTTVEYTHTVSVSCTMQDSATGSGLNVSTAYLYYQVNSVVWYQLLLSQNGDIFSGIIPQFAYAITVKWYLTITDNAGHQTVTQYYTYTVQDHVAPVIYTNTLSTSTTSAGANAHISITIDDGSEASGINTVTMEIERSPSNPLLKHWEELTLIQVSGNVYTFEIGGIGLEYGEQVNIRVNATDIAGNENWEIIENAFVVTDDTNPDIESVLNIDPNPPKDGKSVTIDLDISDVGSGVQSVVIKKRVNEGSWVTVSYTHSGSTYSFTLSSLQYGDTYSFYIYAQDNEGNIAEKTFYNCFTVGDDTDPEIESVLNIDPNPPKDGKSVTIDLDISDVGSGVQSVIIKKRVNEGSWVTVSYTHSGSTYYVTLSNLIYGDTYDFYVYAEDYEGNSKSKYFYDQFTVIDGTPPSISPSSQSYTVQVYTSVSIEVTVTDTHSSIQAVGISYNRNGAGWVNLTTSQSGSTYSAVISGNIVIWGASFDIQIWAEDSFANTLTLTWHDCVNVVDTIAPTISDVHHDPYRFISDADAVTIYATITDSGLGINDGTVKLYYRVDDGEWIAVTRSSLTKSGDTYSYAIPAQSYQSSVDYYFTANDNNNNLATSQTYTYTVNVDTHPPTFGSTVVVNDATTGGTITATVTISDEASIIRVDGWYNTGNGFFAASVTDNQDGTYTLTLSNAQYAYYDFKFEAEDQFNNIGSTSYLDVILPRDTLLPTVQNIQRTPSTVSAADTALIKAEVFDSESGLDPNYGGYGVKLRYKLGSSGTWTYLSMSPDTGNYYKATIPAYATGNVIYYQIIAKDQATPANYRYSTQYSYTVVSPSPPSITGVSHSPWQPARTNQMTFSAYIDATVSGGYITEARVYRKPAGGSYTYYSMSHGSGTYWYRSGISAGTAGKTYYYYIWAKDNYGTTSTSSTYSYTVSTSGGGLLSVVPYQLPENITAIYKQNAVQIIVYLDEECYYEAQYSVKYCTNTNNKSVLIPLVATQNKNILSTTVLVGDATFLLYQIHIDVFESSFHDETMWFKLTLEDDIPPEISAQYPYSVTAIETSHIGIYITLSDNEGLAYCEYQARYDIMDVGKQYKELSGKEESFGIEYLCIPDASWLEVTIKAVDTSGNVAVKRIVIDIVEYYRVQRLSYWWLFGLLIPLSVLIWKRSIVFNKIKQWKKQIIKKGGI